MKEDIIIEEKIHLHNAIMVIGLSGWVNAGEVSTFAVKYLVDNMGARRFGEIPAERFHDYFVQRPLVSVKQGVVQSYSPPRNNLYFCQRKDDNVDLVLLLGCEPHLNWTGYAKAVLGLAKETGVVRVYALGGYIADISEESDVRVTASTTNEKLVPELREAGLELTSYQGPTSVYSEIMWTAREMGVDVISLWCAVPVYVIGHCPGAAYAILKKVAQLSGIKLDLKDIKEKAESFRAQFERRSEDYLQLHRRKVAKEPSYIF